MDGVGHLYLILVLFVWINFLTTVAFMLSVINDGYGFLTYIIIGVAFIFGIIALIYIFTGFFKYGLHSGTDTSKTSKPGNKTTSNG